TPRLSDDLIPGSWRPLTGPLLTPSAFLPDHVQQLVIAQDPDLFKLLSHKLLEQSCCAAECEDLCRKGKDAGKIFNFPN
ncbi:hypothetical protein BaRGS_00023763, partial [Batillaria attramentaria]